MAASPNTAPPKMSQSVEMGSTPKLMSSASAVEAISAARAAKLPGSYAISFTDARRIRIATAT